MQIRLKLDHFLLALGENIGTIGNADEIIRVLRNKWVEYENIEDELKARLDEYYPEGAEILRAIDEAQDRIIWHILEVTALILTENQKSNNAISRYDPLAKVDRVRALVELAKRNKRQRTMFDKEEVKRVNRRVGYVYQGRAAAGYYAVAEEPTMGGVYDSRESGEGSFFFE
jgi:hypothetical protein